MDARQDQNECATAHLTHLPPPTHPFTPHPTPQLTGHPQGRKTYQRCNLAPLVAPRRCPGTASPAASGSAAPRWHMRATPTGPWHCNRRCTRMISFSGCAGSGFQQAALPHQSWTEAIKLPTNQPTHPPTPNNHSYIAYGVAPGLHKSRQKSSSEKVRPGRVSAPHTVLILEVSTTAWLEGWEEGFDG